MNSCYMFKLWEAILFQQNCLGSFAKIVSVRLPIIGGSSLIILLKSILQNTRLPMMYRNDLVVFLFRDSRGRRTHEKARKSPLWRNFLSQGNATPGRRFSRANAFFSLDNLAKKEIASRVGGFRCFIIRRCLSVVFFCYFCLCTRVPCCTWSWCPCRLAPSRPLRLILICPVFVKY